MTDYSKMSTTDFQAAKAAAAKELGVPGTRDSDGTEIAIPRAESKGTEIQSKITQARAELGISHLAP